MGRRWAKYFFFLAAGLAIFYFIEWFFFPISNEISIENQQGNNGRHEHSSRRNNWRRKNKNALTRLHRFFGTEKWIQDRGELKFVFKSATTAKKCLPGDFELTYDKHRFKESDLVIFHARDMPDVGHLGTLLKDRPKSQRWVYALWESPNATPNPAPLNGCLTWTYRSDSEYWSPLYGKLRSTKRRRDNWQNAKYSGLFPRKNRTGGLEE